jgi:hypothetical protein
LLSLIVFRYRQQPFPSWQGHGHVHAYVKSGGTIDFRASLDKDNEGFLQVLIHEAPIVEFESVKIKISHSGGILTNLKI